MSDDLHVNMRTLEAENAHLKTENARLKAEAEKAHIQIEASEHLVTQASAGWVRAHELGRRIRDLEAENARLKADATTAWEQAHKLDAALQAQAAVTSGATYHADSLAVWNKITPLDLSPRFLEAYQAGIRSGHRLGKAAGVDDDIHIEWRVHILCAAAQHASKLAGDFVECGVSTGIYSLAICTYLDFNSLDRDFWLFDTFNGIPASHMAEEEREARTAESELLYVECYELARSNFAPYPRAQLVRGTVPETLETVPIERVAYLSLDMSIVAPERAAIEHFWPKLVPGGIVVLGNYGWKPYPLQRQAMDDFAASVGVGIMLLPTGQGLLIKP